MKRWKEADGHEVRKTDDVATERSKEVKKGHELSRRYAYTGRQTHTHTQAKGTGKKQTRTLYAYTNIIMHKNAPDAPGKNVNLSGV